MPTDRTDRSVVRHEIWTPPNPEEYSYDSYIQQAVDEMNAQDPQAIIDRLKKEVKRENGQAYAVLKGEKPEEYSEEDALVLFDSFSVGPSANRLVRAEFIRVSAKYADIRDSNGKLMPVVMIASPGPGSNVKLSIEEWQHIRNGEFGPVAKKMLETVTATGIGKVSLLGYSQGAAIATAGANVASEANLDVARLSVGEPPNVVARGARKLIQDFMAATDLKPSVEATGLDSQKKALGVGDMTRFFRGIAIPSNWNLMTGMSNDTFSREMTAVLQNRSLEKVIVAFGENSKIAGPELVEPQLEDLRTSDTQGVLISAKIPGADHTWGDQLRLLSKLYIRAVS